MMTFTETQADLLMVVGSIIVFIVCVHIAVKIDKHEKDLVKNVIQGICLVLVFAAVNVFLSIAPSLIFTVIK